VRQNNLTKNFPAANRNDDNKTEDSTKRRIIFTMSAEPHYQCLKCEWTVMHGVHVLLFKAEHRPATPAWSWRCHRQPTNNVGSRLSVVPVVLLSATATTPNCTFTNNRHHQNTNPGVYFLSPGLLQLIILWYDRLALPATAVNTERSGSISNWY